MTSGYGKQVDESSEGPGFIYLFTIPFDWDTLIVKRFFLETTFYVKNNLKKVQQKELRQQN